MQVQFGSTPAAVTVNSDTSMTAVVPPGTGTVDITITTAGGTFTMSGAYRYSPAPTASAVNPSSGPEAGGNTVTITGTGFQE